MRRFTRLLPFTTPLAALFFVISNGPAESDAVLRLVAFGDSLTAGYQLPPGADFASRLEVRLREQGRDVEVVNAGVSGDTASAGLARLDWTLNGQVDGVILELGANDALRGIDPKVTRAALEDLVKQFKAREIPVLLAGMLAPPNLGDEFGQAFNRIFPDLNEKYDVEFYPFFLEGVAVESNLKLADGMHPNEAGVDVIVENILPTVERLIARITD